jgi:hypothetical protein
MQVVKQSEVELGALGTREMLVMCPASKWIGNFDRRRATKRVKVPPTREERKIGGQGRVVVAVGLYPFKPVLETDLKTAERQWIVQLATHRSGIS